MKCENICLAKRWKKSSGDCYSYNHPRTLSQLVSHLHTTTHTAHLTPHDACVTNNTPPNAMTATTF